MTHATFDEQRRPFIFDNIGATELTFSTDEWQALNAALAEITIQGERLPPPVAQRSGVEAPLK